MTEGTPEETPTEPQETPETTADNGPELPPENKGSGRFAVYDTVLMRYVGDVSDKRPSKSDANKLVHTRDHFAVREV